MKYMLDTNTCIYIIKKQPRQVISKLESCQKEVVISSVVLSELTYGACKSQFKEKNTLALHKFAIAIPVVSYDKHAAFHYGEIRADLEKRGMVIGAMDMLIAAHALSVNATLITNNLREFSRIASLRCENWV